MSVGSPQPIPSPHQHKPTSTPSPQAVPNHPCPSLQLAQTHPTPPQHGRSTRHRHRPEYSYWQSNASIAPGLCFIKQKRRLLHIPASLCKDVFKVLWNRALLASHDVVSQDFVALPLSRTVRLQWFHRTNPPITWSPPIPSACGVRGGWKAWSDRSRVFYIGYNKVWVGVDPSCS